MVVGLIHRYEAAPGTTGVQEGSQHGPYIREQFCAFAREERVEACDNVWNSGMASWTPAWEVAGPMPQQPGGDRGEDEAPSPMPGGSPAPSGRFPSESPDVFARNPWTASVGLRNVEFFEECRRADVCRWSS